MLSICAIMAAAPARPGTYKLTQPDGTSFTATLTGDEFFKLTRTTDGCSIIRDDDGYYSYAFYDAQGGKHSTGVHVNSQNSSSPAAASSRLIPYETISRRTAAQRELVGRRTASVRSSSVDTKASTATNRMLIILAQFSDLKFKYGRSYFVDMLTKEGYSYGGANGSALDYFKAQFGGSCEFEFVVSDVVTLSHGYAYYGKNDYSGSDEKAYEAVIEACKAIDSQVDFSKYDMDGDGEVDNVFVYVPGLDEAEGASEDHIWSHRWYIYDGAGVKLILDGTMVNSYAMSTEISYNTAGKEAFTSIGTFCHEYSHALGLRDMYDTDGEGSGGYAYALWQITSVMDGGNYNNGGNTPPNYNAFELESIGVGTEEKLDLGEWTFAPLSSEKRYGRIDTNVDGEYFLVETRALEGWDAYIGGSGLLIYHIDKSKNSAGYSDNQSKVITAEERFASNEVNCRPDHQCVDLIEANPNVTDHSHLYWPCSKISSISPESRSEFRYWNGGQPSISLIGMRKDGDQVTFTVAGPLAFEKIEAFQDAATVRWNVASGSDGTASYISISDGTTSNEYTVKPYQTGQYSYTFEGLKEKTDYTVKVSTQAGGKGTSITDSFTTKSFYSNGYPFIYLNSAERNSDGTFVKGSEMPLRVYNAKNVTKVTWTFNSSPVSDNGSGYWTITTDGTLKASVQYNDGHKDIIMKKITVK